MLSYSQGAQALTAYTSRTIEGTPPYFTFDGGRTRVTSRDDFVSITLPNGTRITPSTNTSSATNPIRLPAGSTLGDIGMLVPPGYSFWSLSNLVALGNWGDDDGDGQGTNGVTATGMISVYFSDKNGSSVSRNDTLNPCKAPYRVRLDVTHSSLTTQYGVPNSSTLSSQFVTYYISPSASVSCFVQFARPNLDRGKDHYAGPSNIWNPDKGFLTQSNNSSSYGRNFPTTGAKGLYFDLEMPDGVDGSQLTWSPVTRGGITAKVRWTKPYSGDNWISDKSQYVTRVELDGPWTGRQSSNPGPLTRPSLPQTFELKGKDSSGNVVVKYGFVLRQWFVGRNNGDSHSGYSSWCRSLGYRFSRVRDLTNAVCSPGESLPNYPCTGSVGARPSSSHNNYERRIGAGFFTEWGNLDKYSYIDLWGIKSSVLTSDAGGNGYLTIVFSGAISSVPTFVSAEHHWGGICTTP
ncbi:hypothetical protein [Gilliamella sp. Pas-s95]|uniref:hypothetical protein n=1 Tax=Gilliamella sp. Pas-s95 TaxID=2687317 RepID=UPI001324DCEA|nr:hypothetical protein [Gilliamella sp. Pas-s95]MWN06807.1 hypothetical protein [Gilliamella sp. Pas-s95]